MQNSKGVNVLSATCGAPSMLPSNVLVQLYGNLGEFFRRKYLRELFTVINNHFQTDDDFAACL